MSALRQARIRQERERERIAESVRLHYQAQLDELTRSNTNHMILIAQLEGEIIDQGHEIERLKSQLALDKLTYQSAITDLVPIVEKLKNDFQ